MKITKKFTFEAAHSIPGHITCGNLHGHSYKLEVTVEGPVKENGMLIDFALLKDIVEEAIVDKLDHRNLDELGYFEISTAENIVIWMWNELKVDLPVSEIKLYETANNFVTYNGK